MAVWSTLDLSKLNLADRIDAEYFQPSFLKTATALEGKGKQLKDLSKLICSAFYPAATQLYASGDIPFIRCVDVISYPVITMDQPFECITSKFIEDNHNIRTVKTGDIVITKVGTPCYAGIVHESLGYAALSRTVLGITEIDEKQVDPHYLVAFLRSMYGYYQLMREREQQIQLQLTLDRVGRINIFLPSITVQRDIGDMLKQYQTLLDKSRNLFGGTETDLLAKLNLLNIDLSHQTTYKANFSEVMASHRFDAEYFQPKYSNIMHSIQSCGYNSKPLGLLIEPIRNGFDYREFSEEGTPYIRVGDIKQGRINLEGAERVQINHSDVGKDIRLEKGNILFTRKGTFGNAAVVSSEHKDSIISSEVMLLRLRKDLDVPILPEYLALFLNSSIGYQQVVHKVHGGAYYSISQPDLARVEIVIPPLEIQEELTHEVQLSFSLEDEAKNLLEQIKHIIEEMILKYSIV